MPSPTSNSTSPTRTGVEAAQAFLERERTSLEAINALGSRSSSGESLAENVAGLALKSSSSSNSPTQQPHNPFHNEKSHEMDIDETASNTAMDIDQGSDSAKIEEWRKQRIEAIARREEESDRQREEDRRRAQAELASFLKEYQAKVEERRSKPIDLASFMSEFDGPERCNKGTATQAPIDWAAVQRLIKLLRVPEGNVAGSERFLQIIKAKAGSMQTE